MQALSYDQSHYRALKRLYIAESARSGGIRSVKVSLDGLAKEDLSWWIANISRVNRRTMTAVKPDLIIASDATLSSWVAVLNGGEARDSWSKEDRNRHINELELLACFLGLCLLLAKPDEFLFAC